MPTTYKVNCNCCCKRCGSCRFSKKAKAVVAWSFSIADAAVDLNGSGQQWMDVPNPIPTEFADVASGSVTISPADLSGIIDPGDSGDTAWTLPLTFGDGRTATMTVVYDCALNGWGWDIAGPGTGMNLSHDNNPVHATNNLGLMSGNCTGAAGTNAIFTLAGGGAEFLATGTVTITIIDNPCTPPP